MIEHIVKLRPYPELRLLPLRHLDILHDRKVRVEVVRPAQRISPERSEPCPRGRIQSPRDARGSGGSDAGALLVCIWHQRRREHRAAVTESVKRGTRAKVHWCERQPTAHKHGPGNLPALQS